MTTNEEIEADQAQAREEWLRYFLQLTTPVEIETREELIDYYARRHPELLPLSEEDFAVRAVERDDWREDYKRMRQEDPSLEPLPSLRAVAGDAQTGRAAEMTLGVGDRVDSWTIINVDPSGTRAVCACACSTTRSSPFVRSLPARWLLRVDVRRSRPRSSGQCMRRSPKGSVRGI